MSVKFTCSNQNCPNHNTEFNEKAADYYGYKCDICKSVLCSIVATENTENLNFPIPDKINPEELPTCLALSVLPLFKEPHPFVRLWRLVDTAEIALRWSVAIALAEVIEIHQGELPVELGLDIKEQLARPTMGIWLSILKTVTKDIPNEPLIATGIFDLYEDNINKLFAENGNEDNSLLELRNNLAHSSGGMSKERAEEIYKKQLPNLANLLTEVAKLTADCQIIHKKGAVIVSLIGSNPQEAKTSCVITRNGDGTYLVKGNHKLSLLPLVNYGTIKIIDQNGRQHVIRDEGEFIQVYANNRKGSQIKYSPIGSDYAYSTIMKDKLFKDLFEPEIKNDKKVNLKSFMEEAKDIAESKLMKGRGTAVGRVKKWIKGEKNEKKRNFENPEEPRIGWIEGKPGMGKSTLVASVARDYQEPTEDRCVFYYKFKVGDFRNNKRMFLESLQSNLIKWKPLQNIVPMVNESQIEEEDLIEDIKSQLIAVQKLKNSNPKNPSPPYFLCIIDGLDEIVRDDKSILPLIKEFAPLRVLWVIASRNEYNLDKYFNDENCEKIFPDGLPPLDEEGISQILSDHMEGASKYKFVGADADKKEKLLKSLVEKSEGLPLYIHHLIDDLGSGNIDVNAFCKGDIGKLPKGLSAYYHSYLERIGISDAKADLTKILSILCISKEPIDEYGLAILLADGTTRADEFIQRVKKALEIGDSLVKISPSPENNQAWTIFHQSFRDYVVGIKSNHKDEAQPPAEELKGSVNDAKYALSNISFNWQSLDKLQAEPLRNHLFRHGSYYSLLTENKEIIDQVKSKLTNFSYLQARTKYLPATEITNLVQEYKAVLKNLPEEDSDFRIWETFFRQKAHILRRGDDTVWKTESVLKDRILDSGLPFKLTENGWEAFKILLQLAVEHADNSPITKAAEAWLETGSCNWLWVRKSERPLEILEDLSLQTFENELIDYGFDASAYQVSKSKIFIHSRIGFMLFSTLTGDCLSAEYSKHVRSIKIDNDFLASWHGDSIIKIWCLNTGKIFKTLIGHKSVIKGVLNLGESKIISWDENKEIKIWCVEDGICIDSLIGDFGKYYRIYQLKDSKKIIEINNNTKQQSYKLILHSINTSPNLISNIELIGHDEIISGVKQLNGKEIISWSTNNICKIWEIGTGKCIKTVTRLSADKEKILIIAKNKIISSFRNNRDSEFSIRIWSLDNEKFKTILNVHDYKIIGAFNVNYDCYISWDIEGHIKMWSLKQEKCILDFQKTSKIIFPELIQINNKYLILNDIDSNTLDVWSLETGLIVNKLTGHLDPITSMQKLKQDKIISFSKNKCKLWKIDSTIESTKENAPNNYVITYTVNNGILIILESSLLIKLVCTKTGKTIREDKRFVQSNILGRDRFDIRARIKKRFKFINLDSGQTLFIASNEKIYSVPTKENETAVTFDGHFDRVVNVLQMDKNSILSYCVSGVFILWDLNKQKIISSIQISDKPSISNVIRINSHMFLAWGYAEDIKLWSIYKNEPISIFSEHDSPIEGVMLLENNLILSWDISGQFKIWSHLSFKTIKSIKLKLKEFVYVDELSDNMLLVSTKSLKSEFKTILLDSNTLKILDIEKSLKYDGNLNKIVDVCHLEYDYLNTYKSSAFVEFVNYEGVVWQGEGSAYKAISFSSSGNYFIENNGYIEHLQLYKGKYPISSQDIQSLQEK